MTNRFWKYLLLGILILVIPYVITMILIIVTEDRVEGMKLGVAPGVILPHLIFGLLFVKRPLKIKLLLIILVTAIIYGLVMVTIRFELLRTHFYLYGFFDLALISFVVGLIVWESYYHTNRLITGTQEILILSFTMLGRFESIGISNCYFGIRKKDLEEGKFENVVFILQDT